MRKESQELHHSQLEIALSRANLQIQAQPNLQPRPRSLSPPPPPFPHLIGRVQISQQRLRRPLRHHPPSPALRCKHELLLMLCTDLIADWCSSVGRIPLTLFKFAYARDMPTNLRTKVDGDGQRPRRVRIVVWIVDERERSLRAYVRFLLPFLNTVSMTSLLPFLKSPMKTC